MQVDRRDKWETERVQFYLYQYQLTFKHNQVTVLHLHVLTYDRV